MEMMGPVLRRHGVTQGPLGDGDGRVQGSDALPARGGDDGSVLYSD
jgi:hypothetical protein